LAHKIAQATTAEIISSRPSNQAVDHNHFVDKLERIVAVFGLLPEKLIDVAADFFDTIVGFSSSGNI